MPRTAPTSLVAAYDAAFKSDMQALNLPPKTNLITALSGGPDSTALACLADRYARRTGNVHQAIVINHNIRLDAGIEAERVCRRMETRSITTRVVTVEDKAPPTGIQEWARQQRFSALTKLARQQQAVLLLGHHEADQAETVLMRLARGSGVSGLAGMRALSEHAAVLVARPLLKWSTEALLDFLALLGCDYEDDPSNSNFYFERVQIRNLIRYGAACGFPTIDATLRLGQTMAALSDHLNAASKSIWEAATDVLPTGHATIDMNKLHDFPGLAWQYHVRRLIRQIGGRYYGVPALALDRLYARLVSGQNSTLGDCQFVRSSRHGNMSIFYAVRELGRTPLICDVVAGDDIIFGGCWRVRAGMAGKVTNAGNLRKFDQKVTSAPFPGVFKALPYVVRRAIPVLYTLDGAIVYPQLKRRQLESVPRGAALSAHFLRG